MATLYIDRRNIELALDGDTLVCRDGEGRAATIPLAPVDRVYLRSGVKLTSGLLAALGARDVAVVILHGRKGVPVLFHPRPHRDARLRCAQYRLLNDDALRLQLAQLVVSGRIASQIELLSELAIRRPKHAAKLGARVETLESMRRQVSRKTDLDALRGLEGAAAHHYFAALAEILPESLEFSGRNRRPPRDPVNAALSLGYTLLHAEAVIAVYGHGFDPYIGFYHGVDYGRESLACDVVEPLRTEVDAFVLALFLERRLRPEHFTTGPHGCFMGKAGRQRFYQDFERAAERIRRRFDELLSALADTLLQNAPAGDGERHDGTSVDEPGS
ncbi:MAG: CRISPR-associated endonuclease Cas1 1 [Rhodothalassiaceae bacterium]|nr:MAG: CRISPR-associated endonuclease Cas1 1 [Rhodothalassiaceae bacterium]